MLSDKLVKFGRMLCSRLKALDLDSSRNGSAGAAGLQQACSYPISCSRAFQDSVWLCSELDCLVCSCFEMLPDALTSLQAKCVGLVAQDNHFCNECLAKCVLAMNGSLHMCEDVGVDGLAIVFEDVAHMHMA